MDFIMRIFLKKCKIKAIKFLSMKYKIPRSASTTGRESIGEFNLDWVGYADDLMLTFNDKDSLQQGIILLDEIFTEYRLKINTKKTQTMIFNHQYSEQEYPASISSLRGKDIENVKKYKYLGCEIKYNEASTGETELNIRCDAATCKFYSLSRNLLNHKINLKTRVLILNSLVHSRLLYF